jgi:hypothetical protein
MSQEQINNTCCHHVKDIIHSVKNILSNQECKSMIEMTEAAGFSHHV